MPDGLTEAEREALASWDDGSYLCPLDADLCDGNCTPHHEHLADVVEAILAERLAAQSEQIAAAIEATQGSDVRYNAVLTGAANVARGFAR